MKYEEKKPMHEKEKTEKPRYGAEPEKPKTKEASPKGSESHGKYESEEKQGSKDME